MSEKESKKEEKPIEFIVGEQMASDAQELIKGRSDARRLSIITECECLALSYFSLIPKLEGGDYAREFIAHFLNLKMSVSGVRSNQLIRLVQGSKGVAATDIVKKPGLLQRNITQRGWKDKAEREGAQIIE